MRPAVVLDACTLIPIRLATCLLWLAEAGLFQPLWSEEILDEVERNLPRVANITPEQAARRLGFMRDAFGTEAMVDGYEGLSDAMTCDPKDRHVLAAAAYAEASVILTFNLRDFPAASTSPHGVAALHPEEFLLRLLAGHPREVVDVLREVSASFRRPHTTFREFMASLTSTVSTFANLAADAADLIGGSVGNTPALEIADEDEALASFGEPGDWTNPGQVGLAWYNGLGGDLETSKALTYDPADFGDYQWAIEAVAERSLASKVLRAVDAPDQIAFMRFVPQVSRASHAFETYMTSMTFLTLVRVDDGTWRAWGLGPAMYAAARISATQIE